MNPATIPCPRRFRRIHDRVLSRDLEWFAHHPGATSYDRVLVPGEMWPITPADLDGADRVKVFLIRPGFRARLPYNSASGQPPEEGAPR